jgi:hypothetical protein
MASIPPRGDAEFVCVSRATPRWVRRRPLLLAGWLRLGNRVRRLEYAWLIGLATLAAFIGVITRPAASPVLAFVADRWVLGTLAAAIHASTSVSRRKQRLRAENESSWLAALPYRVSVPARIASGFGLQLVALAAVCAGIAAAGPASWAQALTVWISLLGGYVLGALFGWFAKDVVPSATSGAQYAIVRRVRENWAIAPELHPLSYWPVAWARMLNNPQVSARTLLFVLLSLPMGTTGAEALAIGAGWMVGLYVLFNLLATVRAASAAGWWLRPTPVRFGPFTRALTSRALLIQVGVFSIAMFFLGAVGEPRLLYLALSASIAWLLLYTGVVLLACRAATR